MWLIVGREETLPKTRGDEKELYRGSISVIRGSLTLTNSNRGPYDVSFLSSLGTRD